MQTTQLASTITVHSNSRGSSGALDLRAGKTELGDLLPDRDSPRGEADGARLSRSGVGAL